MRLIDADAFKNWILSHFAEPQNELVLTLQRFIAEQPTAYDIDKVIAKLEELDVKSITRYKNGNFGDFDGIEYYIKKREAIEIVKQGGVGTETETIRDKAIKWNNNSSKRVPYEFIDFIEGKRDIGVSDDVCEWKKSKDYPVTIK